MGRLGAWYIRVALWIIYDILYCYICRAHTNKQCIDLYGCTCRIVCQFSALLKKKTTTRYNILYRWLKQDLTLNYYKTISYTKNCILLYMLLMYMYELFVFWTKKLIRFKIFEISVRKRKTFIPQCCLPTWWPHNNLLKVFYRVYLF